MVVSKKCLSSVSISLMWLACIFKKINLFSILLSHHLLLTLNELNTGSLMYQGLGRFHLFFLEILIKTEMLLYTFKGFKTRTVKSLALKGGNS